MRIAFSLGAGEKQSALDFGANLHRLQQADNYTIPAKTRLNLRRRNGGGFCKWFKNAKEKRFESYRPDHFSPFLKCIFGVVPFGVARIISFSLVWLRLTKILEDRRLLP